MDKKFIEDLKGYNVYVDYNWRQVDEKRANETYYLNTIDLNNFLNIKFDGNKWKLTLLDGMKYLNSYNKETVFKILDLVKNKISEN